MLARVLFTLVCLVIAAGLLLPLYPSDLTAPRWAALDPAPPAAASSTAACEDCPVPDASNGACQRDCGCCGLSPAALVVTEGRFGVSVILLIHPPAGLSSDWQPLSKLPTI